MLARLFDRAVQERDGPAQPISILDWARQFAPGLIVNYQGMAHQAVQLGGYGGDAYDTNSIVFACAATRMLLFSEARFAYQYLQRGRAADLFVTNNLKVLDEPWPGAQTGDLLGQSELDILACGNSYWVRDGQGYLVRLDPNRVILGGTQITGAYWGQPGSLGTRVGIYTYQEGPDPGDIVEFMPGEICHYKPYPRRLNMPMGMSWLSPCLPDVFNDNLLTNHKSSTLRQGANLSYVVTLDPALQQDRFEQWVDWYKREHEGAQNAGKTLFVAGGADVKTVSQTFEQLAVKATQGAGETRIAACAGVPPVIVGLSEGLAASTYCLPGDEPVWTPDGPVAIRDVHPGAQVWTPEGTVEPVEWQGCVGEKRVYEIRTKNRVLHATANHPVLVRVPGQRYRGANPTRAPGVEWRTVEDLRPGDRVVEVRSLPDVGEVAPEWISEDVARWLGAYVGDGSGAGRGGLSLAIPPDGRVRNAYEALTASLFDARIGHGPRSFSWHSVAASQFLAALGFAGTAKTKRLPGWVFRMDRARRLAFLAGLLDSDGSVDRRGVGAIGFANRALVEQVRTLFVSCGVSVSNVSYRRQLASGLPNPGRHEAYDFWAFAMTTGLEAVPTLDPLYQHRLSDRRSAPEGGDLHKAGLDPDRLGFFTVRSVTAGSVEPVYDLSVGSHAFVASGVAVHNSNYSQARRRLVDGTLRPLWRSFSGAMESIIGVPDGARLWYDDSDIPFLREDLKDQAEILSADATTIVNLIKDGFEPDSAVQAVVAGDLSMLKHTGLVSVQLQPPQAMLPAEPGVPSPSPEAPAAGPAGPPALGNGAGPRAISPPPRAVAPTL
jgi:hypothetical protein